MDLLPTDVCVTILEYLAASPRSVAALATTCSRLHSLIREFGLLQGCPLRRCQDIWREQAWREELLINARGCVNHPSSSCNVDLSCYFSPREDETKCAHVLCTDGTQLVLYDSKLHFMRGWAPPRVHGPGTPQHLHASSPTTISSSLPSYRALEMVILHPRLPLPPDSGSLLASPWPPQHLHTPTLPLPHASPRRAVPLGGLKKAPAPAAKAAAQATSSPRAAAAASSSSLSAPQTARVNGENPPSQVALSGLSIKDAEEHKQGKLIFGDGGSIVALPRAPPPQSALPLPAASSGSTAQPKAAPASVAVASAAAQSAASLMLTRVPCLVNATYLDISYHSNLSDTDLAVLLSKCRGLRHLALAGTEAGPHALSQLGKQSLHDLQALDLSHHRTIGIHTPPPPRFSPRPPRTQKHRATASPSHTVQPSARLPPRPRPKSDTPTATAPANSTAGHNEEAGPCAALATATAPPAVGHCSRALEGAGARTALLATGAKGSSAPVLPSNGQHSCSSSSSSSSSSSASSSDESSNDSSPQRERRSTTGSRACDGSFCTQGGSVHSPQSRPSTATTTTAPKAYGGLSTTELVSGHLGSWGLRHRHPSVLAAQLEQASTDPNSTPHQHSTCLGSPNHTAIQGLSTLHGDLHGGQNSTAGCAMLPSSQPVQHASGSASRRHCGSDGEQGRCSASQQHHSSSRHSLDGTSIASARGGNAGTKVDGSHKGGGGAACHSAVAEERHGSRAGRGSKSGSSWEGGTHAVFVRLLRSTLERLPNLKDLRLCGNHLGGLFDPLPFSPRHQAQHPQGHQCEQLQAPPSLLLQSLSKLERLDLSGSTGVYAQNLALVLLHCPNLKELHCSGCTDLSSAVSGESLAELLQPFSKDHEALQRGSQPSSSTSSPPVPALPALRRLKGGWGLCAPTLETLVCHADRAYALTALEFGVGAGVCDSLLATLGACCANLQELKLTLAPVTDEGVRPLLMGCRKLHILHLIHCIGPFTAALLPSKPSALHQSDTPDPSQHRWTLSSLQILGSRCTMNSGQLMQLIGARPNTLHTLALANCPFITPALLNFLATNHQGLQHIRLEQCGGHSWDHKQWEQCSSTLASCSNGNLHAGLAAASTCSPNIISSNSDSASLTVASSTSHSHTYPAAASTCSTNISSSSNSDSASTLTGRTSSSSASFRDPAQGQRDTDTPFAVPHAVPASHASASALPTPGQATACAAGTTQGLPREHPDSQPHMQTEPERQLHMHAASPHQPDSPSPSCPPSSSSSSSSPQEAPPSQKQRPSASVWPISEASITKLAQACPGLRSVHIRHCCQFGAGILETLTDTCPLLTSVLLDRCDLADNGMRCPQSSFHPLHMIMVARCQVLEPYSALLGPFPCHTSPSAAPHAQGGHRLNASVLIHDLSAGKTTVLHEAASV